MNYPTLGITMSVLESLFSNQALCAEFPFIGYAKNAWAKAATNPTGCKKCGHNRPDRDHRQHLLETIKAGIIGMPPDRISRLKAILGTDKLVLHFAVKGAMITKEL